MDSDKTEIASEEADIYSEKTEIERLSALDLDALGETEFEIVDDNGESLDDEAFEAFEQAKNAKNMSRIIHDIREGLFPKKLQHADYVELLESVEGRTDRHKFLLNIAKKCQKDPKKAAEIIHKIEAVGLSNYFGLDHLNEEEDEEFLSKTALHLAVADRSEKAVFDILLEYISVNCWDNEGLTPLDIAIIKDNELAFNILIEAGAYVGKKDKESHEKQLEMPINPPLRTFILHLTPAPDRKISKKHLKQCLKRADQLIDMGADVHLKVDTFFEPTTLYTRALGIVLKTTWNAEKCFYGYHCWPMNRELALRILNVPTVDLAEKIMLPHVEGMACLTLVDYCTSALSKNYEFLGYSQFGFRSDVERYLVYIEEIVDVLKATMISRLAKRIVEMEKIFAETQITETGQGIHAFPPGLSNIMIQYGCYGNDFEGYATTEPGRALLYSLVENPLLKKEIDQLKKLPNKSR